MIYAKSGVHIDPVRLSVRVLPNPGITLNDFSFSPDKRMTIEINQLKLDMDLKNLIIGRIVIQQISFQNPKINFPPLDSDQLIPPMKFQIIELKKEVKKIFTFLPKHQDILSLTFTNAVSPYFKRMDGSLSMSKHKNDILVNTSIKEFELRPADFSWIPPDKYLDMESLVFDQLALTAKINSDFEIQGELNSQGFGIRSVNQTLLFDSKAVDVSFKVSENVYQMNIKPFKIDYPEGVVSVHFFSDQLQKKSEIQFSGHNIHIDQAKKMSLSIFKNNEFVKDLFDILHNGVSPEINVAFKADELDQLFQPNNMDLKGNIKNGVVKIPATDLTAFEIEGSAEIHNGIFDITATRAGIGTSAVKQGRLSINLLEFKHIPFSGDFLLDVDLSMIPETLGSLLPGTLLAKELTKVHNINGRSNTRLYLSIPIDSNRLDVKIDSEDFSVKGNYDRIPGIISLERANFKYDSEIIFLSHIKGTMIGLNIEGLNADVNFKKEPEMTIKSGSAQLTLESILPFFMTGGKNETILSPLKNGTGKIDIASFQLSGPILLPEKWIYDVTGKGDHLNLTTKLNQRQIENLSCEFHVSEKEVLLKNIAAKIENLSWLEPVLAKNYIESFQTPLTIENGLLLTSHTKASGSGDIYFPDSQKLQIEIEGDNLKSLAIKTIILLDPGFSNATISMNSDPGKILSDFKGILNTRTLHKLLIPESYLENQINKLTEGEPLIIHTDKDSAINILTKKIILTSFSPPSQKSLSLKNQLFLNHTVKLKIETLSIKQGEIKDVDAEISIKNDTTYIRLNKAYLCDFETKGYINIINDRIDMKIPFKAYNKENFQDLLTCLLKKNDLMNGRYTLTGELVSDAEKKNFLTALKGSIIFKAYEGRVYKLTLLSRILSVLNVSSLFKGSIPDISQKGFAYKNISIEADIENSMIRIKNAIIDGNDMTIIFNGHIDLINDYIDLTCLVAPFKTVDMIIEKIPIVNTLLSGNLVSVPVKANGKISDPVVVPLHPSAVGEGLINMMTNILKTPVKLLDKLSYDEKTEE